MIRALMIVAAFVHAFPASKHLRAFSAHPTLDEGWKGFGALIAIAIYLLPPRTIARAVWRVWRDHRGLVAMAGWTLAFVHAVPAIDHLPTFLEAPTWGDGWRGVGSLAAALWFVSPVDLQRALVRVVSRKPSTGRWGMKRAWIVSTSLLFVACAASGDGSGTVGSGTHDSGDPQGDGSIVDSTSSGFDVGHDAISPGSDTGSSGDGSTPPPPIDGGATFGSTCGSAGAPTIKGTVFAPNGVDPVPLAEVYAPIVVNPFPPGVACDTCDKPIDTYWTSTNAAADGTFTLDLSTVPASASVKIAVKKGRFRKVSTIAPACGTTTTLAAAQSSLPGSSPTGDDAMPKIAVGSGNSDHLDAILAALGISTFDCFEGRKTTTSSNCPSAESTGKRIAALLTDATSLNQYNLLFLSCAPGIWASYSPSDRTTIATNLSAWVNAGGRLIATDNSYDYVSQAWSGDVAWEGAGGTPWPVDGANVGDVPASGSITATVDDADLTAWLKIVGISGAPSVSVSGWLHDWSVMSSLPSSSTEITHGSVQYTYPATSSATTADLPLTAEFVKNKCGRVIYSSYHTLSTVSASSLSAQEKILEYLILEVAACLRTGVT